MQLTLDTEYGVTEKKGIPVVSSRKIAKMFEKGHKRVLQDIRELDCSEEFSRHNFVPSDYKIRGKKYPEYLMTKDGFTFLAMGYTGKMAAKFKEAYIMRFNQMERFIESLATAKMEFPAFTAAVMSLHEEPKHYHFSNEVNMVNSIVLGMQAKKFKELNGISEKEASIRPYLTTQQIKNIETLQRVDIGLMFAVPDFYKRKEKLQEYYDRVNFKQLPTETKQ
jgi:Rha family phage regulatory protein